MTVATRLLLVGGGAGSFASVHYPYPPVSEWTIARSSSNPCITIPAAESTEQYVPAPLRLGNGDVWVYVKGNSRIYAWRSTDDGVTFTIQNGGTAVLVPDAGEWDEDFAIEPTVVYDEANSLIHLWYKGFPGPAGTGWSWGHATAPDSDPTDMTKDIANPILTAQDVAVELGAGSIPDFAISSVIKIGSTFHFYGYLDDTGTYYLCQTTGTDWNTPTAAGLTEVARFDSSPLFETPTVIRAPDGSYLMLYSSGVSGLTGSREIYTATSPDGETWTAQSGTVLAPTSGWESNQVYSGQPIRQNSDPYSDVYVDGSGRWLFYYSGLSAAHVAQSGLAYITP